ncbi:MAG TPA: DUF429 domain-containing protein [Mycobacterium sp.]|nr:DUF429 domain-containing protein [Mycobacterium sp.]
MYFVGLDLAWGQRRPSGLAVLDTAGSLVFVGVGHDDSSIVAALRPYVHDQCVVAIDAPLIVTNPTGQRPCETALNRDFRRYEAGAHPCNTSKPELAHTPRGARIAHGLALDIDPRSRAACRAIEVYPHPAMVAVFGLTRTLKYKHKPGRGVEDLRVELLRLIRLLEGLADAEVPMRVTGHPGWVALRREVEDATRKFQLRNAEDPVDAVVCAYVSLYRERRPDDVITYGDYQSGYIVTPALRQ